MARPLRIQYPDAVYHITCRGNERKEISDIITEGGSLRQIVMDLLYRIGGLA
ncbi:MAG TPA: hypothetical protein VJ024_03110 [Thermodesulfovibrionales bacterium]|nr:hypothetical protein [Thermodesulfovibrionales bacterium]